jgi:hypothetical protein
VLYVEVKMKDGLPDLNDPDFQSSPLPAEGGLVQLATLTLLQEATGASGRRPFSLGSTKRKLAVWGEPAFLTST